MLKTIRILNKYDFHIGDKVRIFKTKKEFEKDRAPVSKQIYTITERNSFSFILKNPQGEELRRTFKPNELIKVDEEQLIMIFPPGSESVRHLRKERIVEQKNKQEGLTSKSKTFQSYLHQQQKNECRK